MEKKVANLFKRYQFSEDFIQLVKDEAKKYLSESDVRSNAERQALVNKRKGIKLKRANLESLIVEGTIDREVFKRQHAQLETEIIQIQTKLRELDDKHTFDFSIIEEVLSLSRNIYQTYLDAPDVLKRHYLRLFFERIYIRDQKIVKLIESPIFKTLREEQKLLIRSQWGA